MGISSVVNVLMAIKMVKYHEMDEYNIILIIFTDSMRLYQSHLCELRQQYGEYTENDAIRDYHFSLLGYEQQSKTLFL